MQLSGVYILQLVSDLLTNTTEVWGFVHSYFDRQAFIDLGKLSEKFVRKIIIPLKGIFLGRMNMFSFI